MKRNGLFTNEDDEWVSVSCVNILIDGKDEVNTQARKH